MIGNAWHTSAVHPQEAPRSRRRRDRAVLARCGRHGAAAAAHLRRPAAAGDTRGDLRCALRLEHPHGRHLLQRTPRPHPRPAGGRLSARPGGLARAHAPCRPRARRRRALVERHQRLTVSLRISPTPWRRHVPHGRRPGPRHGRRGRRAGQHDRRYARRHRRARGPARGTRGHGTAPRAVPPAVPSRAGGEGRLLHRRRCQRARLLRADRRGDARRERPRRLPGGSRRGHERRAGRRRNRGARRHLPRPRQGQGPSC